MNKWLKEAQESLAEAEAACERGDIPLENMYMLAPIIYSERKNTNNESMLKEMSEEIEDMVQADWACDPKSKAQYKFHFVSSYLYGFVVAGKVPELKYDEIMGFVCEQLDLFNENFSLE